MLIRTFSSNDFTTFIPIHSFYLWFDDPPAVCWLVEGHPTRIRTQHTEKEGQTFNEWSGGGPFIMLKVDVLSQMIAKWSGRMDVTSENQKCAENLHIFQQNLVLLARRVQFCTSFLAKLHVSNFFSKLICIGALSSSKKEDGAIFSALPLTFLHRSMQP